MSVDFVLECAHKTPGFPEGHPNSRLHGHTYYGSLVLRSPSQSTEGFVRDVGLVKGILNPVIEELDHRYLNDIPDLGPPSSENIAKWIFRKLSQSLPELYAVSIKRPSVQMAVTFFGR